MKKIAARCFALRETPNDPQECERRLLDLKTFLEWVKRDVALNLFDPEVMLYPRTILICAGGDQPAVYMPLQPALLMESLATRPGISPREEALALREIESLVREMASHSGHREIYFICKDPRVIEFAERHGYQKVNHPVLKRKIQPAASGQNQKSVTTVE